MRPLRAFHYYGSKVAAAHRYPPPRYSTIIEPFAGGAGYSLLHHAHEVHLYDLNPDVITAWQYLIATPGRDVLRLPLLHPGENVPTDIGPGAATLIGWCVMLCGAKPQSRMVPASARIPTSFWGESRRAALAQIADRVKHWTADILSYENIQRLAPATWFIDPPYQGRAGAHYVHGSNDIDYSALSTWCRSRRGQVIVCEGADADWLPFLPHHIHVSAPTADIQGRRTSTEMIWTNEKVGT